MTNTTLFGAEVRRLRQQLRLTRAELAVQVGCSIELIRKIERDERRPSRQIAELLATHLAVPLAEQAPFVRLARAPLASDMSIATSTTPTLPF
jgi:transcriptional regulator with XRE-family HTH domain